MPGLMAEVAARVSARQSSARAVVDDLVGTCLLWVHSDLPDGARLRTPPRPYSRV